MIGLQTCVYGYVYKTRDAGESTTQILFTADPNAFFLASGTYWYPAHPGDCVIAEGRILQSGSGVPYLNIDKALYKCR